MADEVSVKFTGSIEGIQTSVTQIREFLQGLEAPIRGVREQLGELAEAFVAAFAVEKLAEFARHMGELGEKTESAAAILGTSTEDIGRLGLVADVSGTSVEGLRTAFQGLALKIVEQSDTTKRALSALGLSFADLKDKSAMGQLEVLADAFSGITDGSTKAAIATALLGRSGAALIPFLNRGAEGMKEISAEADRLGVTLDRGTTEALAGTNREFTLLSASIKGASVQAFLSLKGAIDVTVEIVRDLAASFTEAMQTGGMVRDLVTALTAVLKALVTVIAAVVAGFKEIWATATFLIDIVGSDFIGLGKTIADVFSVVKEAVASFFSGLIAAASETVRGVGQMFANLGSVIAAGLHGDFAGAKAAFGTMVSDADQAGKSIGDAFSKSLKGLDFSQIKNEFAGNAEYAQKRLAGFHDASLQNARTFMQELATIWGTGDKKIEEEHDRHKAHMGGPTDTDAVSAALKSIEGQIKAEQEGLRLKVAVWDAAVRQQEMTEQQRFGNVERATEAEYEAELALLKREQEIQGLKLAQRQDIANKIRALEARHTLDMVKLDSDAIAASTKQWQGYVDTLTTAFNSQLRGLLAGTTSFRQAFKSIVGDLVISFIQAVEKMAAQWVAAEIAKTVATTTGAQARTAAETAGQATGMVTTIANAIRSIASSVGITIAGVSAEQAPLVGPAAPAEGIAAGAAVSAAALGAVASFDVGAWSVPRTGLAMVHQGEFIASTQNGDAARARALMSGGASGGGAVHIHYNQMGRIPQSEVVAHARAMAREIGKVWRTDASLRPAT